MNQLVFLEAAANTAQAGAEPGLASLLSPLLMLVVMMGAMYFIMIRPQNKKRKKEAEMKKNAEVGDEITTIGGISGRIIAVKDETESVVIETGSDKSKLHIKRWAIGSVDTVHEED